DLSGVHVPRLVVERAERGRGPGVCSRIVVVDKANIETEITEGLLVTAVEIHLDVATGEACALADVGVPVAGVQTAGVRVIEAALNGGLVERLRNPAEPVVRDQRDVPGQRRGGWLLSGREAGH